MWKKIYEQKILDEQNHVDFGKIGALIITAAYVIWLLIVLGAGGWLLFNIFF